MDEIPNHVFTTDKRLYDKLGLTVRDRAMPCQPTEAEHAPLAGAARRAGGREVSPPASHRLLHRRFCLHGRKAGGGSGRRAGAGRSGRASPRAPGHPLRPAHHGPRPGQAHAALDRTLYQCGRPAAFATALSRLEFLFAAYRTLQEPLLPVPAPVRRRAKT